MLHGRTTVHDVVHITREHTNLLFPSGITSNFCKMNVLPKRIFINKLPESIRKPDLESKFSHYGKVVSVEILSRKNAFQENQPPFAYVNLETSDENLHRCIRDFANKQWKGEFLNVQIAKENFLSRLKREREEETKPKVEWSSKSHGADILNQPKIPLENGYKRKKVYFDQGEHNVTEETSRNNDNSLAVPTPYVQSRPVDEKSKFAFGLCTFHKISIIAFRA